MRTLLPVIAYALAFIGFTLVAARSGGSLMDRTRYLFGHLADDCGAVKTRAALLEEQMSFVKAGQAIAAKADDEGRDFTPEEQTAITQALENAKGVHQQILALDGNTNLRKELDILGGNPGDLANAQHVQHGAGQTLGEKFTQAPEFKDWMSAMGGRVSETAKGIHSPAVGFGKKDLVTGLSPTSAGALVTPDQLGLLDGLGQFQKPLNIAALITNGTTGSDTVEYARVTGFTNNAAPVAEATTAAGPTVSGSNLVLPAGSGVKPQSGVALEKVVTSVKTIAHWIPATKRALSDAAQIRTLIDSFLQYGLQEELEEQILLGNNTGEEFEGILNVSGIQHKPFDTDLLVTTRKARTLVKLVGRATPTAFVFNPLDNEKIDLMRNSVGDFYFGGPSSNPNAPLWGLPRVESETMPVGTGMVAAWGQAILWDREAAAIQVSDSHADFFIRNLVAILAEMRAAFGVIRPKAFVAIDMEPGGS